jgi:UDPglucose 6-dehydrogenase/GDP-mannose 6-dehydrogenase
VLGLAFRPDTNDIRESPAIPIINELLASGASVRAYDPAVSCETAGFFHRCQVTLCDDLEHTISDAQAIILVTRWDEFHRAPELLAGQESPPVFIDGRRMLDKSSITRYEGIGL